MRAAVRSWRTTYTIKHCSTVFRTSHDRAVLRRFGVPTAERSRLLFKSWVSQAQATELAPGEDKQADADIGKIDLRVGRIMNVQAHPDADDLFVEEVEVGEEQPRTIISGLRKFMAESDLQGRAVVVVSNLKPRKMRGIASHGMLLCASNTERTCVEPIRPPPTVSPGERIVFGDENSLPGEAATPNQVQKRKLWENCVPYLETDSDGVANFKGLVMSTSQGPVKSSLRNATLS